MSANLLAAIVEELGITEEKIRLDALRTLLEASKLEGDDE